MKLKICCQPLNAYKKPSGLNFSTIANHFLINRNVQLSFWVSVLEFVKCLTFVGRILENHQREQKESYETQVEGLKLKVDHLENENSKLQNLFQEKSNVNENICQEVSRLSSENSVIPELKLRVLELQRQKQELEGLVEEQKRELTEKNKEISHNLQKKITEESSQRRYFEEKAEELEGEKRELQGRVEELEEENDHLKRQQLMENEVKSKLREETSRLTAENMDFDELLDQKDRLIKKLQTQVKSLETSQRARQKNCIHPSQRLPWHVGVQERG